MPEREGSADGMRGTKLGWLVACAGILWTLGGSFAGSTAQAQYIPRHCGMTYPDYGSVTIGSYVVLGRHTPWAGDTWWNGAMEGYVGRVARVTSLAGLDPVGCPYVNVDADGGSWGWRVRDMSMASGPTGGGGSIPSWCGMASPQYGPISIGSRVILGAHDAVNGDTWWNDAMWAYVGREATVREFGGLDPQGCPYIRVDIDGAAWGWRIRNMTFMGGGGYGGPPPPAVIPTYCGMSYPDYGPLRVGSMVILGAHTPWNGETWWNDSMWPFVGRQARITELGGLDPNGCPYVRVDVDGAAWGWRIRNMSMVY